MLKKLGGPALLAAMCLTGCNNNSNVANAADGHFSTLDQKEIGRIASEYIVRHPEILVAASKELQRREYKKIDEQQRALVFNNLHRIVKKDTPHSVVDPKHAPLVKVVEFFDYQCAFCSKLSPIIKKLDGDKDVEVVFKETPIFGSRWDASLYAANVGVAIYKQFGSAKYVTYHNAVFDSHKDEGMLKKEDVNAAVVVAGVDLAKLKISSDDSNQDMEVFGSLGFSGTPIVMVMKNHPKSADDIRLIRGYSVSGINNAIALLKKG